MFALHSTHLPIHTLVYVSLQSDSHEHLDTSEASSSIHYPNAFHPIPITLSHLLPAEPHSCVHQSSSSQENAPHPNGIDTSNQ